MISHPTGKFDNTAKDYTYIKAVPLAAAMGAEILGVDITGLTDDQFAEIRHALFRHKMVYLRDQKIGHADQEAFSLRFGLFAEDAYTEGVDGHANVQPVIKEADHRAPAIFGSGWHTDSPFLRTPPAISLLYGIEIPPFGGDTIFSNTVLAYETLSDTMKSLLAPLRVHMSMAEVVANTQRTVTPDDTPLGRIAATRDHTRLPDDLQRKVDGAYHPLVRTHPLSGERSLYCDHTYACGIEGMEANEARAILDFLVSHMTQPAFTCRLRWAPGTLALWDNRICIHQAFNDYDGYRRVMYRTTVAGEAPA